jgi:N6-L-threonylcarbamoyladenine synthase
MTAKEGWDLYLAELPLCTDNAGMIGYAASLRMARGERSPLDLDVRPGLALADASNLGRWADS